MKLNINTYLSKLESVSTLVFGTEEIVGYYSSADDSDKYEALNTEKVISDKLYDLCIMENYVDFFIVYSDDHTVGKVSNGTTELYGDDLYNDMALTVTRNRSKDGWSTGYNNDFRRIYYVKRVNDNALLVASFYTSELENVFVRPDDMRDTAVRLVNEDHYIMYSSENEIVVGSYTGCTDGVRGWYTKPATLYAVSRETEHPEESALLLDFLLNSDEISELQGIEKGIPLSRSSRSYLEQHDMLKGLHYDAFRLMSASIDSMALIDPFMEDKDMPD
ncbi:MAG: hypothetical protein PUK49_05115, partial [Oscillospiraceae bacterium]|nr:hypothetical protein [Oscillospiraceae bacterium]